ncbi:MAG: MarR family transcriptional regulator [Candidatus Cloacimonadota bacterium]|jgi:predicted Zn-ribbon and HTH transcriptional regulator|nr:MAG: MarR family transcriptional regulator [Candidatus Cloacimonadota bacterium]
MADNKEVVLDAMKKAAKPLKAGEIAELAGLDKKEVDKVMKVLKKEELIVSPKRCYWEPKK